MAHRSISGVNAAGAFERGDAALKHGELRAAEDAFGEALRVDGGHAKAAFRLGEIALARFDLRAAEGRFEQALALQHEFPQARHLLDEMRLALDGAGIVGVVRNYLRTRPPFSQRIYYTRLTFEVVQHDGTIARVEMAGVDESGTLRNGDVVALPPDWRPGEQVERLRNITRREYVEVSGGFTSEWPQRVVLGVIALIGLVVIGVWVIFALGSEPSELIDWVNEQLNERN